MKTIKAKRITKKHIGRPVDFLGSNRHEGVVLHGRIHSVANGVARIEDTYIPGEGGGFVSYLLVTDKKIVDIY